MTAPDAQPPAVWWSPSLLAKLDGNGSGLIETYGNGFWRQNTTGGWTGIPSLPADAVRLVAVASGMPVWTVCPTCSSSRPHLHPTADLCPDPFHRPEPATAGEWRAEVSRWADLLDQIGQLPAGTGLDAVARIVADMRREVSTSAAALAGTTTPTEDAKIDWQDRFRQAFFAAEKADRTDLAPLLRDIAWYWRYEGGAGCDEIARALLASTPTAEESTP